MHHDMDLWLYLYCREKKDNLKRRNQRKGLQKSGSLTVQKLYAILNDGICVYCKKEVVVDLIDQEHNILLPNSATIDRVNPLLGYYDSNIVVACNRCNQKKGKREQAAVVKYRYGGRWP